MCVDGSSLLKYWPLPPTSPPTSDQYPYIAISIKIVRIRSITSDLTHKIDYKNKLQIAIKHAQRGPERPARFSALYEVNAPILGRYATATRVKQLFNIGEGRAIAEYSGTSYGHLASKVGGIAFARLITCCASNA